MIKKVPSDRVIKSKILAILDDMKAQNVTVLDVKALSSSFDMMIIASGTSTRHNQSMAEEIVEAIAEKGLKPIGTEGKRDGEWVLIDYGNILVHLMKTDTRAFFQLEKLWSKPIATPKPKGKVLKFPTKPRVKRRR